MRRKPLLLFFLLLGSTAFVPAQTTPAKTPGAAIASSLKIVEHDFVPAAEAMPADKYDFAPTGGEFKGVRTFAQQVKHVASANYMFGSVLLGEKPPVEGGGENGPATLKTKAEIMKYLEDSFAYLDKAMASVTDKNALEPINSPEGKSSRLSLASFAVAHPFDHYGQMVVYLRMNGIIPPSSRPESK